MTQVAASTLFVTLILGTALPGAAQELSANEVVRLAADSNPALRLALLEARRAEQGVTLEESRLGWTFTAEAGATHTESPQATTMGITVGSSDAFDVATQLSGTFETGTRLTARVEGSRRIRRVNPIATTDEIVEIGPTYDLTAQLTVTQPLLRGFGIDLARAPIRVAESQADAARAARDRAASEVLRDALTAYWQLWYASVAEGVEREALQVATRQRDDAQARVAKGTLAAVEVLSFEQQVAAREEAIAAAALDRQTAGLEVGRILGTGPTRGGGYAATAAAQDAEEIAAAGPDEAARIALRIAPELQELRAGVEAARAQVRLAGEQQRPRFDVEGWVLLSGVGDRDAVAPFEQVGTLGAVSAHLGAVFELPLSPTLRRAEHARALLALEAAEARLHAGELSIDAQARTLAARVTAQRQRLALAQRSADVARQLVEAERARFGLGTTTPLQVLTAEDALRSAELRVARAHVDARIAALALAHLTGQLLGEHRQAIARGRTQRTER